MFDRTSDTFGEGTAILGSITSFTDENSKESRGNTGDNEDTGPDAADTDTIAGETTTSSSSKNTASTNIDVVGLAVFRDDVLVRRTYCH